MPAISPARASTVATHAWAKPHTQIMSWVSGVYECCLCMVLMSEDPQPPSTIYTRLICHSLAASFRSVVGACTGIVEPFKHLLCATAHPQILGAP